MPSGFERWKQRSSGTRREARRRARLRAGARWPLRPKPPFPARDVILRKAPDDTCPVQKGADRRIWSPECTVPARAPFYGLGPGQAGYRHGATRFFGRRITSLDHSASAAAPPSSLGCLLPIAIGWMICPDELPRPLSRSCPLEKTAMPSPRRQQPLNQGSLASCRFHPVRLRPSPSQPPSTSTSPRVFWGRCEPRRAEGASARGLLRPQQTGLSTPSQNDRSGRFAARQKPLLAVPRNLSPVPRRSAVKTTARTARRTPRPAARGSPPGPPRSGEAPRRPSPGSCRSRTR